MRGIDRPLRPGPPAQRAVARQLQRNAIAQLSDSGLAATGIVMNLADFADLRGLKDANGQYLGAGPWETDGNTLWGGPVAATAAMAAGTFLVGDFPMAAQIFDRMDLEVLVSTEDRDNFIRNMITVRAEERLALAIKRASALVYGTFGVTPVV